MGIMPAAEDGDLELVDPSTAANVLNTTTSSVDSTDSSTNGAADNELADADGDGVWSSRRSRQEKERRLNKWNKKKSQADHHNNHDESYYTRGDWIRFVILFVLMTTLVVTTIVVVARKDPKKNVDDPISPFGTAAAGDGSSTIDPTAAAAGGDADAETQRALAIASYINQITLTGRQLRYPVPPDDDDDMPTTTEEKALTWVIDTDPAQRQYPDEAVSIRQRYALALFWFQGGTDGSTNTTPFTDNGLGLWNNTYAESWMTDLYECSWTGITCEDVSDDEGYGTELITYILLYNSTVQGTLSVDIALLQSLLVLQVNLNQIVSPVPWSLATLPYLVRLDLGDNLLSEPVPDWIGNITSLTYLSLAGNDFSGSIPPSYVQNLVNLTNLLLYNNHRLEDQIPDFSNTTHPNLEELVLRNCSFTGTLPESLFHMASLTELDVSGNAGLDGKLNPTNDTGALFSPLTKLYLHGTSLTGNLTDLCNELDVNMDFNEFAADCDEVICPCCNFCCPFINDTSTSNETEPWLPKVQCNA